MEKFIRDTIKRGDTEIILDTPPDFITMSSMDIKTHKPRSKHILHEGFYLLQYENSDMLTIPIGYRQDDNVL